MRVLCAPDSFKETLAAPAVAAAMARGAERSGRGHTTETCPIADGGEGTLEVLAAALRAQIRPQSVSGPLGEPVEARFAIGPDGTGIVALADASGLTLVRPEARDPLRATTRGTGELIVACARAGCRRVIVCLGGSATVDGGAGIAEVLDAAAVPLPELIACCDVGNPLLGPHGAAAVYGPQKGADPDQVARLEQRLADMARAGGGDPEAPGAGAAGGAGWGLATFFGARLVPGAEFVLDALGFDERLVRCDLLLTGEGRLDAQTLAGKAPLVAARRARDRGVPVAAVVGIEGDVSGETPFDRVFSLTELFGTRRALQDTASALAEAAEAAVRDLG